MGTTMPGNRPMPESWPFQGEPSESCTMCSWAWHPQYGFAIKYANRGCDVHGRLIFSS